MRRFRRTFQERALATTKKKEEAEPPVGWLIGFLLVMAMLAISIFGIWSHHTPNQVNLSENVEHDVGDAPPSRLRINGDTWSVYGFDFESHTDDYGIGTQGMTECIRHIIWYDSKIDSAEYIREVMWHEVLHASACKKRIHDPDSRMDSPQHDSIYWLGQEIPWFVRDNPDFVAWAEEWKPRMRSLARPTP